MTVYKLGKPVATKQDVFNVARDLMLKNGQTTTLEIKEEIWKQGFYLTQRIDRDGNLGISELCSELFDEYQNQYNLSFTENGQYRTYTYSQTSTVAPQTQVSTLVSQPAGHTNVLFDWEVSDRTGTNPSDVVQARSRDHARWIFEKNTKTNKSDCRAKQLK
jgi:hypothetical protein